MEDEFGKRLEEYLDSHGIEEYLDSLDNDGLEELREYLDSHGPDGGILDSGGLEEYLDSLDNDGIEEYLNNNELEDYPDMEEWQV